MERTIKCVLIAAGSRGGYPFSRQRVVECRADQRGYRTERGVKVLWESGRLYRPHASRGKGPEAEAQATEIAAQKLLEALGVNS